MNTSNPYHGERRAGTVGFPIAKCTELKITDPTTVKLCLMEISARSEVVDLMFFKRLLEICLKKRGRIAAQWFFITGDFGAD